MNATTIKGDGQELGGNLKEAAGTLTGNTSLRGEGIVDQLAGNARQIAGAAKDALADPAPVVAKAKGFAQTRPYATAALVGVVGLALLNTLRGR